MKETRKRTCKACQQGEHSRCDSEDAIGNFDYCGPRPICDCLGSDEHPV